LPKGLHGYHSHLAVGGYRELRLSRPCVDIDSRRVGHVRLLSHKGWPGLGAYVLDGRARVPDMWMTNPLVTTFLSLVNSQWARTINPKTVKIVREGTYLARNIICGRTSLSSTPGNCARVGERQVPRNSNVDFHTARRRGIQ
jgi:hypothetical protein